MDGIASGCHTHAIVALQVARPGIACPTDGTRVDALERRYPRRFRSESGNSQFPRHELRVHRPLPRQDGLTFDGDDLSPVTYLTPETAGFAEYLPGAVAHRLRPNATTLVLGARGGLDVVAALANGAARVTAVESNEIAVEAVHDATGELDDPRVQYVVEDSRAFVQRTADTFDIVQLALTQPYRPVTSGAYSLAENFDLTVEGFRDLLQRLNEDGILVVTRWLQTPPSEGLRLFALVVTAAEQQGLDPSACVIALRGYNTVTVIAQCGSWTGAEIDTITDFAAARRFDLIYAPGLSAAAANRYNVLPEDPYYRNFHALISAPDRHRFYADYPFDVTPPTDDWPFFGHYFKWTQAGELWAQLGKTWQPFGGAGYYVLLFMLGFVSVAAAMLILLPLVVRGALGRRQHTGQAMAYFAVIGLGFLFVEIPLTQRLILYVERPDLRPRYGALRLAVVLRNRQYALAACTLAFGPRIRRYCEHSLPFPPASSVPGDAGAAAHHAFRVGHPGSRSIGTAHGYATTERDRLAETKRPRPHSLGLGRQRCGICCCGGIGSTHCTLGGFHVGASRRSRMLRYRIHLDLAHFRLTPDLFQKLGRVLRAGDSAVEDIDDAVGIARGERVVSDHDHRLTGVVEIAQQLQDLCSRRPVQAAGWFVSQQQRRFQHNRAALPPRALVRLRRVATADICLVGQPHCARTARARDIFSVLAS